MARFLLRIELHKKDNKTVTAADYAFLHKELASRGFIEEVNYEGDNRIYQLPTGLYRKVANITLDDAEKLAHDAGNATVKGTTDVASYSYFLVEYTNSRKHNLNVLRMNQPEGGFKNPYK